MTLKLPALLLEGWLVCITLYKLLEKFPLLHAVVTLNDSMSHVAGALTAVFVCPLDVLKTRLQVQGRAPTAAYRGIGGLLQDALLACSQADVAWLCICANGLSEKLHHAQVDCP